MYFRLAEGTALRMSGGTVQTTGLTSGATITFPAEYLRCLVRFHAWTTLAEVLPDLRESAVPLAHWVGFLSRLVEYGVLQVSSDGSSGPAEPWSVWGAALDYYLTSRSRAAQPFVSVAELDQRLAEKAIQDPQPSAFKDYPNVPVVELPSGLGEEPGRPFTETLFARRTYRTFGSGPLDLGRLAQLLMWTWGATVQRENPFGDYFIRRTSPSGGSLHSVEVYPVLLRVEDVPAGVYHYSVRRHVLEQLRAPDPRRWLVDACGGQRWVGDAAAVFVSTAFVDRNMWKYTFARAFRYPFLDAGHLSQTFCLSATALHLAPFSIGALRDEIFERNLGLDFLKEPVLFVNGVGTPPAIGSDIALGRSE